MKGQKSSEDQEEIEEIKNELIDLFEGDDLDIDQIEKLGYKIEPSVIREDIELSGRRRFCDGCGDCSHWKHLIHVRERDNWGFNWMNYYGQFDEDGYLNGYGCKTMMDSGCVKQKDGYFISGQLQCGQIDD